MKPQWSSPSPKVQAVSPWRPLRSWPASSLHRLSRHAAEGLRGWATDWQCTVGEVQAWNVCDGMPSSVHGIHWSRMAPGGVGLRLWLGASHEGMDRLMQRVMFAAMPADADTDVDEIRPCTIAETLGRQAADELMQAMAAGWGSGDASGAVEQADDARSPPEADHRRWSGAVRVRVSLRAAGQGLLWLHLPGVIAAHHLSDVTPPEVAPIGHPLADVSAAVGGEVLRLRVGLDSLAVDIGDLMALRPGDVIRTSHRLDAPLRVDVAAEQAAGVVKPLCFGHLGTCGAQKAVALARPNLPGTSSSSSPANTGTAP